MPIYMYRRGNGNEGNYARRLVELSETDCPYRALRALVVNDFIPRSRTRRHIIRELWTDGEPDYGIHATVYEGPNGEQSFGAAWLTAELEPYSQNEADMMDVEPVRMGMDRAARRVLNHGK